jgi:hypothetical protein
MKKKVFGAAIFAAVVSVSAWNISRSTSETTLSDVALANVEALAGGETDEEFTAWSGCIATMDFIDCGVHKNAIPKP